MLEQFVGGEYFEEGDHLGAEVGGGWSVKIPGFLGPRNDGRIHRAFFVGRTVADPPTSEHYGGQA
jgi:hypothetical protein